MTPAGLPPLPALRRLDDLADLRPVVVIDSREQAPLPVKRLRTVRAGLQSGDYSVAGLEDRFAVERKSIPDLVASLTVERERFARELHRLRGFDFARLLIVGSREQIERHEYRSKAAPAAIINSLCAIEARGVPVVFSLTPEAAGVTVETWSWWFAREQVQQANGLLCGCTADEIQVGANGAQ